MPERPDRYKNMNPNPLKRKKQVHVDCDWEVYIAVKATMFKHGLTMPEIIEEFFRLVSEEDTLGMKLVERCYKNKLKREIDTLRQKEITPIVEDMDASALYDMIEEAAGADDESPGDNDE